MKTGLLFGLLAFLGVICLDARSLPDRRTQVWAVETASLLKEPPGWTGNARHEMRDLAFSPDGKQLALTITHDWVATDRHMHANTHLIVINVDSPEANARQFGLSETCGRGLSWNEAQNTLLVCGTLLRLADGGACDASVRSVPPPLREFSSFGLYWLDAEHVIRSNTGEILDMNCEKVASWPLESGWFVAAVAPSRDWLVMERRDETGPAPSCQYSILGRSSRRVLAEWPTPKLPCSTMLPVVASAVVCLGIGFGRSTEAGLHCWEVDGRKEIPIPKQWSTYEVFHPAASSPRVVAEKWQSDRDPWWTYLLGPLIGDYPGSMPFPRERAVLDLRAGERISAWKPHIQDSRSPLIANHPYRCALSLDGRFVAEAGDGVVDLYRLP
jgi:hypothetical protein